MATTDNGKVEISTPDPKTPAAAELSLSAPPGWTKKIISTKGRIPRNDAIFISPAGEEIKNKKQLDQYLRSHPGGLSPSEFDWGAGDTPRRSARLSGKVKATETPPETEPPKKRERKSSLKKSSKEVGGDTEDEALEKETIVAGSKDNADTEMTEVDDGMKKKDERTLTEAINDAAVEANLENDTEEVAEMDQGGTGEPKEEVHDDGKNVNSSNKKEDEDEENNKSVPEEDEVITEKKNTDEPKEEAGTEEKKGDESNEGQMDLEDRNLELVKEEVEKEEKEEAGKEEVITEKKDADEPKEEAGAEEKKGDESNEGQVNLEDRNLEIIKEEVEKNLDAGKVGPVQSADNAKEEAGKEEPPNSELRGPISLPVEEASAENAVKYEEVKPVGNHIV